MTTGLKTKRSGKLIWKKKADEDKKETEERKKLGMEAFPLWIKCTQTLELHCLTKVCHAGIPNKQIILGRGFET